MGDGSAIIAIPDPTTMSVGCGDGTIDASCDDPTPLVPVGVVGKSPFLHAMSAPASHPRGIVAL